MDGAHPLSEMPLAFSLLPHPLCVGSLFVIPNDYSVKFTKSSDLLSMEGCCCKFKCCYELERKSLYLSKHHLCYVVFFSKSEIHRIVTWALLFSYGDRHYNLDFTAWNRAYLINVNNFQT